MIRRSIFHNKILISSLKYVRNQKSLRSHSIDERPQNVPWTIGCKRGKWSSISRSIKTPMKDKSFRIGNNITRQLLLLHQCHTHYLRFIKATIRWVWKENLCIILLGILGLSEEILLFTLSLLCRWIYRQDFLWNALFSMNRAGGKNLDKQNIIGTANKQFPCKKG